MLENLNFCSKDKREETDFIECSDCLGSAHNPAPAGSLVQIQPPQPNHLPRGGPVRKVQRRSIGRIAIQSSSVVERSAVNRLVVGSNPTSGANFNVLGLHSSK